MGRTHRLSRQDHVRAKASAVGLAVVAARTDVTSPTEATALCGAVGE
jgi:hypothetical protein